MRSEGWRGKTKTPVANWRVQARRQGNMAVNRTFSIGGMARRKPPSAPTLPKLKFMEPAE